MSEKLTHKEGTFCWVDLSTTDLEAAKKFYTELFGWTYMTHETSAMPYTTIFQGEKAVAGLAELQAEVRAMGVPPHWMSYLTSKDVSKTLAAVKEAGGNVIMDTMPISDHGAMGIFQDPEGATLALWQPKSMDEELTRNIPGSCCWNEKGSHDSKESLEFYGKVFGWENETSKMSEVDYTVFKLDGKEIGGMYIMPEFLKDIPSHWMPYFITENIEELIEKAKKLGGEVPMDIMQVEGVGKFCVVKDVQGAAFGVIQ
jgi:uncharacterized protein